MPPFKPSPLSFGSPRPSPFRRPSTPNSPPTQGRSGTPGSSPSRGYTPVATPSKLNQSVTVEDADDESVKDEYERIPQPNFSRELPPLPQQPQLPPSPTKGANVPGNTTPILSSKKSNSMMGSSGDAGANLTPAQLREIREAFQVLDRDNDGFVNRDDVADVLVNVGTYSNTESIHSKESFTNYNRPKCIFIVAILPTRRSSNNQLSHLFKHPFQPRHPIIFTPRTPQRLGRI